MAKPFIRVRYDRMHNQEFMILCKDFIKTIPDYDLKALQIETAFRNFERNISPLLGKLEHKERKMPQTTSIDELRKRLEDLVSALLLYVKSLQRAAFAEQSQHIAVCGTFIRRQLKSYVHESLPARASYLNLLFKIAKQKPEYQQAYDALGINRFMQEIAGVQQQIAELEAERKDLKLKQAMPGTTVPAKEQIISELKLLLMTIELLAHSNGQTAYEPLINRININLMEARAQLRNRTSRRKTRKAKTEKKPDEEEPES